MEDVVLKNAIYEVYEIIRNLSETLQERIPEEMMIFLYANKNEEHNFLYDNTKSILNQKTLPETNQILSIIYYDYICESEEEKHEIEKRWEENQKSLEFNSKKFFEERNKAKENKKIEVVKEEVILPEVKKEKFFTKIINKIKNFFKLN